MQELIIASCGFIAGAVVASVFFRWGISYATQLIYKIKEDIPLENMGKPLDQDGTD